MAADFNGDGKLDLALSDSNEVLFGAGDGTFLPPEAIGGDHPTFYGLTATGDFDGDKNPDLVYFVRGSLAILLGNGDGTFRSGPTGEIGPGSLYVADFNEDGRSDLVLLSCFDCLNRFPLVKTWGGTISFHFGQRDGTLPAPVKAQIPLSWWKLLVIGDFNGDGWPDVATSNTVLLGRGDGALEEVQPYYLQYEPDEPPLGPVAAADLDGDSNLDLVYFDTREGRSIYALPGKGDGTLWPPFNNTSAYWLFAENADRRLGGVADLDGDGRPDLVTAIFGGGDGRGLPFPSMPVATSVTVLLNRIAAGAQ